MPSLNLPTSNKVPGDANHTSDTNLIIEAVNTLKSQVDGIPAGPTGAKGDPGNDGADGVAATVTIGSTTTSAPGSNAAVTNGGDAQNAVLEFTIPRGSTGPTGATGPQGAIGPPGPTGPAGPAGPAANIGNVTPSNLGVAAAGVSTAASREDHVHNMPSASDVGADASGTAATEVSTHNSATTSVHGIADTSVLETTTGAQTKADTAVSTHNADTTSVHGIADTSVLVIDSDSRLTDARTPTAHASSHASAGSDPLTLAPSQITGTAVVDADSRLTDARTPTAHAASHQFGGADALTLAQSQVTNLTTDLADKAPLASPALTGTPTAPTAALSTNTTQIATTEYVQTELANIDALPSQTGQAGNYLTTDGSTASWAAITTDPTPSIFFLGGM